MSTALVLPDTPVPVKEFLKHLGSKPVDQALAPFKAFEDSLRSVYAQQPGHAAIKADPLINCVPLFDGYESELKIRARDLESETKEQQSKYIAPLDDASRKMNGTAATVGSLQEFQENFSLFSEGCLANLDWTNVVAAGSSVLTPLQELPAECISKRSKRKFYHEDFAPASDIDLFLYGLDRSEALLKMQQIEATIRDNILLDVSTVRTRYAVTIVSRNPNRHVQVVLRLYSSISEILCGFDVDSSAVAYDGNQVWSSPRGIASFLTQINNIDITRRSPSYENRLFKYATRGFEIYWPLLERKRLDPTIFDRHFPRTKGLARLLVLEMLPKPASRDNYRNKRRAERGAPYRYDARSSRGTLHGNVKDAQPEDVADWTFEDDYSNYHSFSVPYGPKYDAKRIEKLMWTRDLLLNVEWNRPKDRSSRLHRHPCFVGDMKEIQEDCCGECPPPSNLEDEKLQEEESRHYVSGKLTFLEDNPGRQEIGSFEPLTEDDWTSMAYIGNTAQLCKAIVENDLNSMKEWCYKTGSGVNVRDHTGRTPLHLAVISASIETVQFLIDQGARVTARIADGKTALHMAAIRGNSEMVSALLRKSEANEEEEANKQERRRVSKAKLAELAEDDNEDATKNDTTDSEDYDDSDADDEESQGFVKVAPENTDALDLDNKETPDVFDVNTLAWDIQASAVHLAIVHGHHDLVKLLVSQFGADALLPWTVDHNSSKKIRITLYLATILPLEQAKPMILALVESGAMSAQADSSLVSAFHSVVQGGYPELVELLFEHDTASAESVKNGMGEPGSTRYSSSGPQTPLMSSIKKRNQDMAMMLISHNVEKQVTYDTYIAWLSKKASVYSRYQYQTADQNMISYKRNLAQPLLLALDEDLPEVMLCLAPFVDVNCACMSTNFYNGYEAYDEATGDTILDRLHEKIVKLQAVKMPEPPTPEDLELVSLPFLPEVSLRNSYEERYLRHQVSAENQKRQDRIEQLKQAPEARSDGRKEKYNAAQALLQEYERVRKVLLENGAKTGKELGWKEPTKHQGYNYYQTQLVKEKPFSLGIKFAIGDITEKTLEGYKRLYEAAWSGDAATVKKLTTGMWGNNNAPLVIAVRDAQGWSPFFIACYKGHLQLAQLIVEIARIQYKPKQTVTKFTLKAYEEYDDCYSESDDDDMIVGEKLNSAEMIGNMAIMNNTVKSDISPLNMMSWEAQIGTPLEPTTETKKTGKYCLMSVPPIFYAIRYDQGPLFRFLARLLKKASSDEEDVMQGGYNMVGFDIADTFRAAAEFERIHMLKELISIWGYGIPAITEESPHAASKYYKGLKVGGKVRTDWAQGRGGGRYTTHKIESLVLRSAIKGGYQAAEFFLGEGPRESYRAYIEANQDDEKVLAHDGLWKSKRWWNQNEHLLLHCVVMGPWKKSTGAYIEDIVERDPSLLEMRDADSRTPLLVAVSQSRLNALKLLISMGANTSAKDGLGRNMAHLIAVDSQGSRRRKEIIVELMKVIPDMQSLLVSCSTEGRSNGKTPLAYYMESQPYEPSIDDLKTMFSVSRKELKICNDHGDYPLHSAVSRNWRKATKFLIEQCPEVLHRENATGRTPLELATDARLVQLLQDEYPTHASRHATRKFEARDQLSFVQKDLEDGETTYDAVVEATKNHVGERRLVTLFEAKALVDRLARETRASSEQWRPRYQGLTPGQSHVSDEVAQWWNENFSD